MASPVDKELFDSLLAVREMHPEVFFRLVQAVRAKSDEVTVAVTEASIADLPIAQGRAQNARSFLRFCIEVAKYTGPRQT